MTTFLTSFRFLVYGLKRVLMPSLHKVCWQLTSHPTTSADPLSAACSAIASPTTQKVTPITWKPWNGLFTYPPFRSGLLYEDWTRGTIDVASSAVWEDECDDAGEETDVEDLSSDEEEHSGEAI